VPPAPSTDDDLDADAVPPGPVARAGRPRRYEATDELQRIFDAAFEVMRRGGYQDVTVADILTEAGMSTRSFYRHFTSKDELLQAMFRQDAERFSAAVSRRVELASTPWDAVVTWIDEILGFGLGRPRARRAAVLGSPTVMRTLDPDELRRTRALLVAPLTAALAAGAADGSFVGTDPEADAAFVSAVAWETSNRMRERASRVANESLRASALSFVERAIGARTD